MSNTRRDLHRNAHIVIDALVDSEPTHANIDNLDAWRKAVRCRIRAEHWRPVLAALEVDPDIDPVELAATIRQAIPAKPATRPKFEPPNPSSAIPHVRDMDWRPATPDERALAKRRLAEIRHSLNGVNR